MARDRPEGRRRVNLSRKLGTLVLCLAVLGLAACSATFRNHGYIPPAEDLAQIQIGDTQETVASAVGRPGTTGILADSGWFYVKSRYRNFAWREAEEIDRQVLAISFSDAGRVTNIERFGLEEGRVVRLSRRVTTPNTQGIGLLRQAFGNLGRFNPADFFDNN